MANKTPLTLARELQALQILERGGHFDHGEAFDKRDEIIEELLVALLNDLPADSPVAAVRLGNLQASVQARRPDRVIEQRITVGIKLCVEHGIEGIEVLPGDKDAVARPFWRVDDESEIQFTDRVIGSFAGDVVAQSQLRAAIAEAHEDLARRRASRQR